MSHKSIVGITLISFYWLQLILINNKSKNVVIHYKNMMQLCVLYAATNLCVKNATKIRMIYHYES